MPDMIGADSTTKTNFSKYNDICFGYFWMPVERSGKNKSTWESGMKFELLKDIVNITKYFVLFIF